MFNNNREKFQDKKQLVERIYKDTRENEERLRNFIIKENNAINTTLIGVSVAANGFIYTHSQNVLQALPFINVIILSFISNIVSIEVANRIQNAYKIFSTYIFTNFISDPERLNKTSIDDLMNGMGIAAKLTMATQLKPKRVQNLTNVPYSEKDIKKADRTKDRVFKTLKLMSIFSMTLTVFGIIFVFLSE